MDAGVGKVAPSPDSWRGTFKASRLLLLRGMLTGDVLRPLRLLRRYDVAHPAHAGVRHSPRRLAPAFAGAERGGDCGIPWDVSRLAEDRCEKVAVASGILACASLFAISAKPESPVVLVVLVAATGAFAISAQNHLNALVSNAFPAEMRSSALGFTLGLGRLGAGVRAYLWWCNTSGGIWRRLPYSFALGSHL